jgi:Ni/Co efflux regulator RcnB
MKSNALAFAIAAASLGFSTLTLAQDHDRRRAGREEPARTAQQVNPREIYRMDQRAEQRDARREQRRENWLEERSEERRHDRRDDRWDKHGDVRQDSRHHDARIFRGHDNRVYYYNARSPDFRRGGYIPREFRNPQYRVMDYRTHHLSAPPRGHQWVQVGADYVLIAMATGLIAHIVLNY